MPPWLASNEFWPAARIRTPNEVNRKTSTSATVRMTANALISSDATLNVAPKILVEPFESPGIVIAYCVSGKTMPMTPSATAANPSVAMTATKCGRADRRAQDKAKQHRAERAHDAQADQREEGEGET